MVDRIRPDDPEREFNRLLERIERLETATYGRNASVTRGSTEFVGEDSLIVRGSQLVVGTIRTIGRQIIEGLGILTVLGRIEGSGILDWTGSSFLRGPVDITGKARLLSELEVLGKVVAGGIRIEGDMIHIGESMVLDPEEDGGAALFSNGSKLYSNPTAIGLRKGSSSLTVGEALSSLLVGGKAITVTEDGISLTGVREVTSADGVKWLGITNAGEVVKVAPGVGGPGASLAWPFPPSMVTSEYGPREVTIEGASAFHEGIDFGVGEGAPIPAAGAGRVTVAGPNGGYGNHVRIDHGGGLVTTYSHMATMPTVTVGQIVPRGYELGPVGDTGVSGAPHLHFEVQVNGSPVNPRSKLPQAA